MKKRYSDGTEVEGTPEEIEQHDLRRSPVPYWCGWGTTDTVRITNPASGVQPRVIVEQPQQRCAIADFFAANPDATSVMMVCYCPRCSVRC